MVNDTWYMIHDIWYMTNNRWYVVQTITCRVRQHCYEWRHCCEWCIHEVYIAYFGDFESRRDCCTQSSKYQLSVCLNCCCGTFNAIWVSGMYVSNGAQAFTHHLALPTCGLSALCYSELSYIKTASVPILLVLITNQHKLLLQKVLLQWQTLPLSPGIWSL